jgi:hypothetical protein
MDLVSDVRITYPARIRLSYLPVTFLPTAFDTRPRAHSHHDISDISLQFCARHRANIAILLSELQIDSPTFVS